MDRNLWIAIALSIAVYAVWFGFVEKRVRPPAPQPLAAAAPASTGSPPTGASAAGSAAPASGLPARDPAEALAQSEMVSLGEAEARVHPRGAALISFRYPEPLGRVELVSAPDPGLFATWPELEFTRNRAVKNGLIYAATRGDGLNILKEYKPGEGTVLPRLSVTVLNATRRDLAVGPWTLTVGPGLGTIDSEKKENPKVWRAVALTPESPGLKGRIEVLKPGRHEGPFRWVGVDNRYFLAALMPSAEHFEPAATTDPPALTLTAKPVTLKPGGSFSWEVPYYLGPKGHTWLTRYGVGLERSIDFGFFAQLGRGMLAALELLHRATGNWGWSIVVLTLALQVLLFPLTYKSLKAAAAMKMLQPEIAKLQKRHADDPQKLNAETMALYKTKGANPLGGCLPMLLQMPIFIALFNALRNSWELHGAVWMFWIRDLSAKDPYYVLPLVMGGLMFLQSKLSPPAGDRTQQQMMMFMPIVFTFMFLNFPSGLVLYWLTNSLVSTVLQLTLKDRLEAA
ncbi:MAG TPA: hypothetical protein DCZ01_11595 [Elusimicrobia bacterium]|nr:MAG: hypothetical protein A2X37_10805 [Elusimicrobia bacterium GWA2_66_18]HAZ09136.1 hypothetical protein [Elusimicrobiota bacterium]